MQTNCHGQFERRIVMDNEKVSMESLAVELPREQQRVRDLLPLYDAIPTGVFAATLMRQALTRAEQAAATGDVIGMLRSYEELKGFTA